TKLALHSLFVSEDTFFASSFSFQSSSFRLSRVSDFNRLTGSFDYVNHVLEKFFQPQQTVYKRRLAGTFINIPTKFDKHKHYFKKTLQRV
ncbi:hypothetical protein, partial [Exiguobacterium antarcticum]|uniref:hypothetical protein n=2 Tax=Exiguobacterium TaxID=33986 RepID=UPI0021C314AF